MASDEPSGTATSQWLAFFKDAGIPPSIAVTYALAFSDNRIRMDMLLDLNKEYLRDMGITMMGDVIAILKHAKSVHDQTVRERILGSSSSPTTIQRKSSTPASRMIEHYVRKDDDSPSRSKISDSLAQRLGPVSAREAEPEEVIPVKKVRRVLPEHEGKYKVTMPKGNTPRTRKLLSKQEVKKTVFERLGDGVSSTSDTTDNPQFTITGLGAKIVKTGEKSSVFSRLGEKPLVSSSVGGDEDDDIIDEMEEDDLPEEEPLQYAGILKQSPVKRKVVPSKKTLTGTMQADQVTVKRSIKPGRLAIGTKVSTLASTSAALAPGSKITKVIKTRGPDGKVVKIVKVAKKKEDSQGIFANPTNAVKLSVKERLGAKGASDIKKVKKVAVPGFSKSPIVTSERINPLSLQRKAVFVDKKKFVSSKVAKPSISSSVSVCSDAGSSGSVTLRSGVFSRLGRN